jgi:hypothetical protein
VKFIFYFFDILKLFSYAFSIIGSYKPESQNTSSVQETNASTVTNYLVPSTASGQIQQHHLVQIPGIHASWTHHKYD